MSQTDAPAAPPRQFRTLPPDETPHAALTWHSRRQRGAALVKWRRAVFSAFGEHPRCLRVAWVLSGLFHADRGYAHASDPFLAKETGIALNKLQAALTALDRGGAIVRVHRFIGTRAQRHIYPAATMTTPAMGGADTPHLLGGQSLSRYTRPRSQLDLARAQAAGRSDEND